MKTRKTTGSAGMVKQKREKLDLKTVRSMLEERISSVDIAAAAEEVRPFLRDARELTIWSRDFFLDLVPRLQVAEE